MCRFVAYCGHPILLSDVLVKPENSLINQSYHARESAEPLNGDGFGLGWYDHSIDPNPGIYKSVRPAWNDMNLIHLSEKIKSTCLFAHVRAASEGSVNGTNCHPFYYKNLIFMHNGSIGNFQKIKRHLRRQLDDDIYEWVKGQTDSEHMFALLLQQLRSHQLDPNNAVELLSGLKHMLAELKQLQLHHQVTDNAFINTVISNGKHLLATRYITHDVNEPRTLYYSTGSSFRYHDGACHMDQNKEKNGAILIVSEKLTDFKTEWQPVAKNQCVLVEENLDITLHAL